MKKYVVTIYNQWTSITNNHDADIIEVSREGALEIWKDKCLVAAYAAGNWNWVHEVFPKTITLDSVDLPPPAPPSEHAS